MLKNIFRVVVVMLVAGIIALGWYAFSLSPAAESLTPAWGAAHSAQAGVVASTGEAHLARVGGGAEGGFSLARGLGGFLKHALILAGVTVAVLLVRKVIVLLGAWRENRKAPTSGATVSAASPLDRRQFLHLAGLAAAGGALAVVYKSVTGRNPVVPGVNPANSAGQAQLQAGAIEPAPTQPTSQRCVACPKGLINDPYPGQCHDYFDADNDGLCDYSIPYACNSSNSNNNSPAEPQSPALAENNALPGRGNHLGHGGRRRQRN